MIDSKTLASLEYQSRRMRHALAKGNTREAEFVQNRVDQILDARPRVFVIASDGEVIYDNVSDWVKGQVCPTLAQNLTGEPEYVLVDRQIAGMLEEANRIIGLEDDGLAGV